MKDFLKKNALSLLSLAVSVTTLVLFWCRFEPFTWSSFGVMATVMGVIVTFLVGFQIWAVIDNREQNKDNSRKIKELVDVFNKEIEEIKIKSKSKDEYFNIYKEDIRDKLQFYNDNFKGFETYLLGDLCNISNHIANKRAAVNNYDETFFFYRLRTIQYLLRLKDYATLREGLITTIYVLLHNEIEIENENVLLYLKHISIYIDNYGKDDEIGGLLKSLKNLISQKYQE